MKKLSCAGFSGLFIIALLLLGNIQAQAQTDAIKHVRIDVAHGGLHCPFLGPQLQQKIMAVQSAKNVKLFPQESYISFELPVTTAIDEAQLIAVAVRVGYPQQDVKVTIAN